MMLNRTTLFITPQNCGATPCGVPDPMVGNKCPLQYDFDLFYRCPSLGKIFELDI